MSGDLSQFKDAFFEESAEHLQTMEEGLLQLEQAPSDLDLLNRIFRAAHSIKGNSGMFGFTAVMEFTHKVEGLLDKLRTEQIVVTEAVMTVLLEATDGMKSLVEAAQTGQVIDPALIESLKGKIESVQGGAAGKQQEPSETAVSSLKSQVSGVRSEPETINSKLETSPPACRYDVEWAPPAWVFQRGLDPSRMLNELRDLGTVSDLVCDASHVPDFSALNPEECHLRWNFHLETSRPQAEIEAVFDFVRDGGKVAVRPVGDPANGPSGQVPPTLEGAARVVGREVTSLEAVPQPVRTEGHKFLGEILVEQGTITEAQLQEALKKKKPIGQVLVEEKLASPQQVQKAIEKQKAQDSATAAAKKGEAASIRVDTVKIDKLINLVGELVITQSMLSDLGRRFEADHLPVLLERLSQLERNTREIQERVMSVRMMPIGGVFNRFPRLVRDLASKNGKKIALALSGETTEIDKTVIESIGDPLTHLVRNSADHGLEPPEERIKAGKPEQGVIKLNAYHEGGSVCITISDDGRGLNREKILAKAVKNGLIAEGESLPDEQIWALIFKPGFSTAEKVTDVSGRGVGMDVVKRNIEGLGGKVTIATQAATGTTFTLKLPLTLAIIEGMTVRVGKEAYILPLVSILESIRPTPSMVKTVVGKGEVVSVRGAYVQVIRLHEVFHVTPDCTDPSQAILVIVETEGDRVAIMVDDLLGQQQVVIKSLEQNFKKIDGVAGATILGDGTVALILDVHGVVDLSRVGSSSSV